MARQRLNPNRRKALRVKQSLSHNVPAISNGYKFWTMRHGKEMQNIEPIKEPLPTIAERQRVKKAHAR